MRLLEGVRRLVARGQVAAKAQAGYEQPVMRAAWRAAGESLGLAHTYEAMHGPFRDALFGVVAGWPVLVRYLANYAIQKPETVITVLITGCQPAPTQLSREEILQLYDRRAGSKAPGLSREVRDEFSGRGLGVGLAFCGQELSYRRLYGVDEAYALEELIRGMVEIARGLAEAGSEPKGQ